MGEDGKGRGNGGTEGDSGWDAYHSILQRDIAQFRVVNILLLGSGM